MSGKTMEVGLHEALNPRQLTRIDHLAAAGHTG